ncbi:MAG: lysyl-tRNA synthetase [Candidatus Xenolissoclinum pacificiensis L6]|uniref:Lysine--tRNA ligase n=1 Tax=Candidatus Xenolissoclinum pacificiensis L6 TaxID=1401685 RepID=W2V0E8_9RICK|nr:MAG: lysyl-tRNA synthetase [Candidatus Xenolissoclinum pacificiensis L6]
MKESWPFVEARKVIQRAKKLNKESVIFETGYGPSGLPHLGTFAEIKRTEMIMNAVRTLSNNTIRTKLYVISDDLDALRKVPDNIPNKTQIEKYIGCPLSSIPDPFEQEESYGEYMNKKLISFLDRFVDTEYEFKTATQCYKTGLFNDKLVLVLENYDQIMDIMLKTIGEERQLTYSPFLPISPVTGQVLQVKIEDINVKDKTISFYDIDQEKKVIPVTDGYCKLQWKPDWGMRWATFGIDYEMHGKDLTPSAIISAKICNILREKPPELFVYELFLDSHGKKISKSSGNGVTLKEWLRYGNKESLMFYMFNKPNVAKKLDVDSIPKVYDEYLNNICKYNQEPNNYYPVWSVFISRSVPIHHHHQISYALIINLLIACNIHSIELLWKFLERYKEGSSSDQIIIELAHHAFKYYQDRIQNTKKRIPPSVEEQQYLKTLVDALEQVKDDDPHNIQQLLYDTAKKCNFSKQNMKKWFKMLYQTILGLEEGPRFGSFIALYGVNETISLIQKIIDNK